jgi:hypothetical protein
MTDIFMTSFFRKEFTERCVREIHERTTPGTFQLHIYDNGSNKETRNFLCQLLDEGKITSLVLDSRNTGCLYNKGVFHMMVEASSRYYIVNDTDVYPPKLAPDWLEQMIAIMDKYPEVALLAPQLPPQWLQMPYLNYKEKDIVYCKAVGNTLKMIRREAFPLKDFKQALGQFGDDGLVSEQVAAAGYKVAFCRNIFCYHAGQCINWGYKPEEIAKDPRKAGYGKPFTYPITNWDTYEPPVEMRQ